MSERQTFNQMVEGSIPSPLTNKIKHLVLFDLTCRLGRLPRGYQECGGLGGFAHEAVFAIAAVMSV